MRHDKRTDEPRDKRPRRRGREIVGTLAAAAPGEDVRITRIEDSDARAHALRFGMGEGSTVRCLATLPAGPVVLRAGRQEIAVGRRLARCIHTETPAVA